MDRIVIEIEKWGVSYLSYSGTYDWAIVNLNYGAEDFEVTLYRDEGILAIL